MNIQTKFKVGDEIFTFDKACRMKKIIVDKVTVYVSELNGIEASYKGKGESAYDDYHKEVVCFVSEEELIKYVKGK